MNFEATNEDGTINFNAYNPIYLMNESNHGNNSLYDTMDKISTRLSSGNIKMERNIEKLDSNKILESEEENYSLNPNKLVNSVESHGEKLSANAESESIKEMNISNRELRSLLSL